MVVLTVVAPTNDHTIYLKHPLPKPKYIRLISCSLYNTWLHLKTKAEISTTHKETKQKTIAELTPGHYTPETIAKILTQSLKIPIVAKAPQGTIAFNDSKKLTIGITNNLRLFFNVNQEYHNFVVKNLIPPAHTSFTVIWLTRGKTCSTVLHQMFWLDLTSKGNHTKKLTTKQRKIMSYATPQLANM